MKRMKRTTVQYHTELYFKTETGSLINNNKNYLNEVMEELTLLYYVFSVCVYNKNMI